MSNLVTALVLLAWFVFCLIGLPALIMWAIGKSAAFVEKRDARERDSTLGESDSTL